MARHMDVCVCIYIYTYIVERSAWHRKGAATRVRNRTGRQANDLRNNKILHRREKTTRASPAQPGRNRQLPNRPERFVGRAPRLAQRPSLTCAPTPPFPPAANCRDLTNCRDHAPPPTAGSARPRPANARAPPPPPRAGPPAPPPPPPRPPPPPGHPAANPRRQAVPSRQACPARRRPGSLARTSRLSVVPLSQVLRPGWDPCPACKGSGAKNGLDFDDFCMANVKLGCIPYKNRPDRSPVEGAGRGLGHFRRPSAANCRTANCRTRGRSRGGFLHRSGLPVTGGRSREDHRTAKGRSPWASSSSSSTGVGIRRRRDHCH